MLTVTCPQCRKPSRIRPEAIGQKIRCPHCALIMIVPARESGLLPDNVGSISGRMSNLEVHDLGVELGSLDDDDDADPDDILGRPNPSLRKSALPLLSSAMTSTSGKTDSPGSSTSTFAVPPTRRLTRPGSATGSPSTGRLAVRPRDDSSSKDWKRGDFSLRFMNYAILCFFVPLLTLFLQVIVDVLLPLRERDTAGFLGLGQTQEQDIFLVVCGISAIAGGILMVLSRVQLLRLAAYADARTLGGICLLTTLLGLASAAVAATTTVANPGDVFLPCVSIVAIGSLILAETSFHLILIQVGFALRVRHIARDVMVLPLFAVGIASTLAIVSLTTNYLNRPAVDTRNSASTVDSLQHEFALLVVGIQLAVGVLIVSRYRAVISRVRQGLKIADRTA